MIKRIEFVSAGKGGASRLRAALEAGLAGEQSVRPLRVTLCHALDDVVPGQRYEAVGFQWFSDTAHLARFEEWSATGGGPAGARERPDAAPNPLVVAEERVVRGAEWLERHWLGPGESLKHMAVARRAEGLTAPQFSERWRSRAGTVQVPGAAGATMIPEEARGLAYVQNHPLVRPEGEWAYDAVNEVYFDTEAGLARRIAWFDETLGGGTEDDLVAEHSFLVAREVVLGAG